MKTEKERILTKIQKCLNLSKSSNPNEAAQALKQAQALMRKHNIDAGVVDDCKEIAAGEKLQATHTEKTPKHIAYLINAIEKTFCVKGLLTSSARYWGRWLYCTKIEFYGNKSDVIIAEYAFNFLLRLLKKHRADYYAKLKQTKDIKPSKLTAMADNYAYGWVRGVYDALVELRPYGDEAHVSQMSKIDRYITEVYGELKSNETKNPNFNLQDVAAMRSGYADGKEVEINRGVAAPDQQNMLAYALQ